MKNCCSCFFSSKKEISQDLYFLWCFMIDFPEHFLLIDVETKHIHFVLLSLLIKLLPSTQYDGLKLCFCFQGGDGTIAPRSCNSEIARDPGSLGYHQICYRTWARRLFARWLLQPKGQPVQGKEQLLHLVSISRLELRMRYKKSLSSLRHGINNHLII